MLGKQNELQLQKKQNVYFGQKGDNTKANKTWIFLPEPGVEPGTTCTAVVRVYL